MKKLLWRIKLSYYMLRYDSIFHPIHVWKYSNESSWIETYFEKGYTPEEAYWEDFSYN